MMEKLAAALLAVLLCSQVGAADDARVTRFKISGDWSSAKVCSGEFCLYRAFTDASNWPDRALFVDFNESGRVFVTVHNARITDANLRTWRGTSKDRVNAEFRVDRNRIIRSTVNREIDRAERIIYESLDPAVFSMDFVNQLRTGQTLRIRYHFSEEPLTTRFSLKGAAAAIDRAVAMARENADDGYFSEKPSGRSARPSNDSEFFL